MTKGRPIEAIGIILDGNHGLLMFLIRSCKQDAAAPPQGKTD